MLLGFKRAIIQPFDKDGKPDGDRITIEGADGEGATQEASISGLAAEPVKIYGSDIVYYVVQKGVGEPQIEFKFIDMPQDENARILGYKKGPAPVGGYFIGEDTQPPYCGVVMESCNAKGETAIYGAFKGKFSKSDIALKTKEGGQPEPEGQSYTFALVSSTKDGDTKGQSVFEWFGKENDADEVRDLVLGEVI